MLNFIQFQIVPYANFLFPR